MRLFVAISPGDELCAGFEEAVERLRPLSPSSKWVRMADCHITVVFLGEVEEARLSGIKDALLDVASRHAPMRLNFGSGGSFGRTRRPTVLWAAVSGQAEALAAVKAAVDAALLPLGFPPETRTFTPHVTLARARDRNGDPGLSACAVGLQDMTFGEIEVDELILFRSDSSREGPRYTAMLRAPLGNRVRSG